MSTDPFHLTGCFNREVCGIADPHSPQRLEPARKEWTLAALLEEVQEFKDAQTLEDEVDALIDLIYFAAGRMQEMGVDGARAFVGVHMCNMRKVQGSLAKRPGSKGHDAVKPEGWRPPDYSWLREPVKRLLFGTPVYDVVTGLLIGNVLDHNIHMNEVAIDPGHGSAFVLKRRDEVIVK